MDGIHQFDGSERRDAPLDYVEKPQAGLPRALKVADVLKAVSRYYEIEVEDLKSPSRRRRFAQPRQLAAYLARELTGSSYPLIGRELGNRDHTTILFSWRKIRKLRKENELLDERLDDLLEMILLERSQREAKTAQAQEDYRCWMELGHA